MAMTDAEQAELQEYRRQDLLRRMQEISREHWAAGWKSGLEHDLYLMTFHGLPADYGMSQIAPAALARLKQLAELTQVWWAGSTLAIALDEAERRFSRLVAQDQGGVVRSLSIPDARKLYADSAPDAWDAETIAAVWRGMQAVHLFRLRSLPLITLVQRENEGDWELRFGDTTVDFVKPGWAKKP